MGFLQFAAVFAAESGITISGAERIYELPKFEVTDSRLLPQPEKWNYAEIPGFEVLSNISARETKRFVGDFLLLQEALNILMPGLRPTRVAVPTSLILTGRGDAFNQFMPVDRGDDRFRTNSLFFNEPERGVIVVDFALAEVRLEDNTTLEADAYRSFYKEYFRYIIRRNTSSKPPAWFEEGLVQLFAAIDFNKKWITFAMIGDGFGGEKTGDFNQILNQRGLMPLGKLFEDPPQQRGTFWSAQAYAFVHMCLYGRNQKYQRPFIQFIRRLEKEPVSEQLFRECFRMPGGKDKNGNVTYKELGYKEMALELRGYIGFTDYKYQQVTAAKNQGKGQPTKKTEGAKKDGPASQAAAANTAPPMKKGQLLPDPPPFELKDAPDAVVGRIKGEALRIGGHGTEARNALIAPYVRGERDPRLLAAIGLDEILAGNDERAMKFLDAAVNAKVDRARAYLELARLRLKAAKAKPGAPKDQLTHEQVTAVLTPLFAARKLPPPMAEVYALIAETWSLSVVPPQREHFDVVIEGVKIFPRDTELLLQAVLLAMRRGFEEDGRALAKLGEKVAAEVADQDRFRMLGTMMERDADPTAAVEAAPKPAQKTDVFLIKPEP